MTQYTIFQHKKVQQHDIIKWWSFVRQQAISEATFKMLVVQQVG